MMPVAQFVADCRSAAAAEDAMAQVARLMEGLVANPAALAIEAGPLPETIPPLGIEEVLHEDDTLTVMVIATPNGIDQPPHDHQIPAIIGVFAGSEEQRFFVRAGDTLSPRRGRVIDAGAVLTLGKKAIHAISAPGKTPCRAVHVYLGSLSTIERSLFDPETFAEEPLSIERYAEFCRPT